MYLSEQRKKPNSWHGVLEYMKNREQIDGLLASASQLQDIRVFQPLQVGKEALFCVEVSAHPLTMWVTNQRNIVAYKAMMYDALGMISLQFILLCLFIFMYKTTFCVIASYVLLFPINSSAGRTEHCLLHGQHWPTGASAGVR